MNGKITALIVLVQRGVDFWLTQAFVKNSHFPLSYIIVIFLNNAIVF